jgi:hypothetical protein
VAPPRSRPIIRAVAPAPPTVASNEIANLSFALSVHLRGRRRSSIGATQLS